MHVTRNVFSKTRISSQSFYCDRRINIVVRVRSFTKRIRQHCKIYNEIKYSNCKTYNKININKLQNDKVDYFGTTKLLIGELIQKSSFVSNHDLVLTLHYLTSIKKPLIKVCSSEYIFHQESCNTDEKLSIIKGTHENEQVIIRLLYKCQKILLKYLIESDTNKTLTPIQRYYLIIALQKECDLVTLKDWLQLYESITYTLTSNLVNKYKTNEIANLLLIYDQISRYSYKRNKAKDNKFSSIDNSLIDPIQTQDESPKTQLIECRNITNTDEHNMITKSVKDLEERRKYDPFNLDFVNISIFKIESCLDELNPEKIIKILYLINSRQHYSDNFFQNSVIHFESNNILNNLKTKQVICLFNLYTNAYNKQTVKYIENYIQDKNLSETNLVILDEIINFDKIEDLNNNIRNRFVDSISEVNQIDEGKIISTRFESLGLCTMILVIECVTRIPTANQRIFGNIDQLLYKLMENFEKDHEWKDIIKLLERKLINIENLATHNQSDGDTVIKFLNNLNDLIKANLILLKILETQNNISIIKKIKFSIEFFTDVFAHFSNSISLQNLTIESDVLDKNIVKQPIHKEIIDYNSI